jgi:hypothetical protein
MFSILEVRLKENHFQPAKSTIACFSLIVMSACEQACGGIVCS